MDEPLDRFPYTAEQLRASLLKAIREGAPEDVKEGIAALLAIHYPKDYELLEVAVAIAVPPIA